MDIFEHISQKVIYPINIKGLDLSITNEIVVLWASVVLIGLFFFLASRKVKILPHRAQNMGEIYIAMLWEYLEPIVHDKSWLPFFCSLFSMILFCNLLGLIPEVIPPTTNINFTAALAILVFAVTLYAGIKNNGFGKYLRSFIPGGMPWPILFFIVPIELISQLARPFSLAVRLFANIFAGHAVVLTIIGMIFMFKSYWVIPGSVLGVIVISAFEIFVALIQAFVFTFLAAF